MRFYDFDKLQKDFLAAMLKQDKTGVPCEWFILDHAAESSKIISDGHFLAIVPDDAVFVTGTDRGLKAENLMRCVKPEYEMRDVTETGLEKKLEGKRTACILRTEDGEEIWIDKKYLGYFTGMDYKLMGINKKSVVQVYVLDRCVGLILPINH